MNIRRLDRIIAAFKGGKVAVVGDLMLDVYIWGDVSRISQEAPVPVVRVSRRTSSLGGASNVMRNIVTLGGKCQGFGLLGGDLAGAEIRTLLKSHGIAQDGILTCPSANTIEKQRVLASHQQLLRIDYDPRGPVSPDVRGRIADGIKKAIRGGKIDALIIEDYAKGLVDADMAADITDAARAKGLIVALDPHPNHIMKFKGLTLMTPNRNEAYALAGVKPSETALPAATNPDLRKASSAIREIWNPEMLLITLGAEGMALYEDGRDVVTIPTRAREVYDVSGAGDTVIGAFVLALLGGADSAEAAEISNHAAGVVVGKVGTVSVTVEELKQSFRETP